MTDEITSVEAELSQEIANSQQPRSVLRSKQLKQLYAQIKQAEDKAAFGSAMNQMKSRLESAVVQRENELIEVDARPIDVTAPMDVNSGQPSPIISQTGTVHPISREIKVVADIFERMGYVIEESREIDDQFHMFDALNFPKDHPARDDYDTFMTKETDANGQPFVAPAHTSTMQNRILQKYHQNLENDRPIAAVVPDRVFRNEDLDARHEHTFYQVDGVFVAKDVHAGMLIATLKTFLEEYYQQELEVRLNPFYFPFTEPSFELALSCPFCKRQDPDCRVCSGEGWIELLGCGMIHPNVLKMANIDPAVYTGFAFGGGIDRLVMMKHQIEDVRHFESARLDFLKQF